MQMMIYLVLVGLLIATLGIAIVAGGWMWILPVIIWPGVIGYGVYDRRAKRSEGRGERLAAR